MIDRISTYFFSGTGNARNVARWISQSAESKSIINESYDIAEIDRLHIHPPPEKSLVFFCSPTHGFNYPPVMIYFLLRFPKSNRNDAVLVNTRAGSKLGPFVTYGLSGIALYLAAIILILKGYRIRGMFSVDMPSNWMSIHPSYGDKQIRFIHDKMKVKVLGIAERLLSGSGDYRAFREIIQDAAISPVSILYYLYGRFFFAKSFIASKDCNNCGLCIRQCPVKAIIKIHDRPFWTRRCESCMHCISHCPSRAIETAHGFIIGIVVIFYAFISGYLFKFFSEYLFPLDNPVLKFALESAAVIILLFAGYRFIHLLMGFKIFERLIVLTSLTKYKFWGKRYKAIKE